MDRFVLPLAALFLALLAGVGAYFVMKQEPQPQVYLFDEAAESVDPTSRAPSNPADGAGAKGPDAKTTTTPPDPGNADEDAATGTGNDADTSDDADTGDDPDTSDDPDTGDNAETGVAEGEDGSEETASPQPRTGKKKRIDLDEALATKVKIRAQGKTLREVADMIGEAAGIAVNLDAEGSEDVPVTLEFDGLSARDALTTLGLIAGGLQLDLEDGHVTLRKP